MTNATIEQRKNKLAIALDPQSELIECIEKAKALVQVMLSTRLELISNKVFYYFLWSLSDILDHLSSLNCLDIKQE